MSSPSYESMQSCFASLILAIGEDQKRSGLENTPSLSASAFLKLTSGYQFDPATILRDSRFQLQKPYMGFVEIPDIAFISLCEHTFLPFLGTAEIIFEPRCFLAGAGAFDQLVDVCSKRLQLQENLTRDLANIIFQVLEPKSVTVKMRAKHCCMDGRELKTQVTLG